MILRAAVLADATHCDHLDADRAATEILSASRTVWVDLVSTDREESRAFLADRLGFHELAVEDALSDTERPGLQEFEDTTFLVVPALAEGKPGSPLVEVAFFLRSSSLVTVANQEVEVLHRTFDRWNRHPSRFGEHPAYLLHALVDGIVDEFFPALDELEDRIEEVSDRLFEGKSDTIRDLLALKKRVLELRRALAPVREVMNSLLRRDLDALPDDARIYFQDVYDHVLRLMETADIHRDTMTSLMDVHLSTVSNNLNEVVRKMTVFSTVLMTMALVAGVYGMNFERMPELHWRYGYEFALGLMFTLGGLVILGFRWAKWL